MSDHEKKDLPQDRVTSELDNVEVQELDEKSLEEASGGLSADQEISPVGDTNNFQCYC
jgi:hypothetical protein